jgi:ketosteroid isomerase-like protein
MSLMKRKEVVERYVDAFNRGDLEGVCRCFAPDALVYGVLGWGEVPKVRPIWEQLINCFRMNLHAESMAEEGDIVAVRYTERGKFVAPFRGTEPTGKSYEVVAMEWFEVSDAGITRRWGARDSAAIFRQMGIPLG